jgi:predicted Zn-ribbon and HTH transcriptional regulator
MKIKLDGYQCQKCGHEWAPRNKKDYPRMCPKCKSVRWDKKDSK